MARHALRTAGVAAAVLLATSGCGGRTLSNDATVSMLREHRGLPLDQAHCVASHLLTSELSDADIELLSSGRSDAASDGAEAVLAAIVDDCGQRFSPQIDDPVDPGE